MREGISVAMLRRMRDDEDPAPADAVEDVHELMEDMEPDSAREGAPLSR